MEVECDVVCGEDEEGGGVGESPGFRERVNAIAAITMTNATMIQGDFDLGADGFVPGFERLVCSPCGLCDLRLRFAMFGVQGCFVGNDQDGPSQLHKSRMCFTRPRI